MSWSDLGTIAPVVAAVLAAAAVLIVDLASCRAGARRSSPRPSAAWASWPLVILIQAGHTGSAFGGAYSLDNLTRLPRHALRGHRRADDPLRAWTTWSRAACRSPSSPSILIFAVTGAMLIAGSTDLVLLFVALELMVLPGYVLAGFARRDPYSTEGAIKYFLLGSFSSAILLFGLAYVWGITGTTRVDGVTAALAKVAARRLDPARAWPWAWPS